MLRLCKPLLATGILLITLAPLDRAQAQSGSCGASCDGGCDTCGGGCGHCGRAGIGGRLSAWYHYEPSLTWYAPYPYWWPQYFNGPSRTDYQLVQYVATPAETAQMVKERIQAINAANPILLPPAKETLPLPKSEQKPKSEKQPPLTQLP